MERLKLYQKLLDGTFEAELDVGSPPIKSYLIENKTPTPVKFRSWWLSVKLEAPITFPILNPGERIDLDIIKSFPGLIKGDCLIYECALTGSFMGAHIVDQPLEPVSNGVFDEYLKPFIILNGGISPKDFIKPNVLFNPPAPTGEILIPPDSPRILVGAGYAPQGSSGGWNILIHEQYWKRSDHSCSVPPNSEKTIIFTHKTGRVESSSSLKTTSETLGTSLSAGWGPVSASISGSISHTTSSTHSVTLSDSNSVSVQDTFKNESSEDEELYLYWQVIDSYTFLTQSSGTYAAKASLEMIQSPPIARLYKRKHEVSELGDL